MRSFILILTLFLSITSCTQTRDYTASPVGPMLFENSRGLTEECQTGMIAIASQEAIYFAENGTYTENLEDLGRGGMSCPACGTAYILQVYNEGESFRVDCPLTYVPNHGYIHNGQASWTPGAGDPQQECRANMRTIASQEVIYFAEHSKYTEDMKELGLGGIVCPGCRDPYILQVSEDEIFVGCPLQGWANHGNVNNGVPSWRTY